MRHYPHPVVLFNFERVENEIFKKQDLFLEIRINPDNSRLLMEFKDLVTHLHSSTTLEVLDIAKLNEGIEVYKNWEAEGKFCLHIHKIDSIRPIINLFRDKRVQLTHLSDKDFTRQAFLDLSQKLFSSCQKTR